METPETPETLVETWLRSCPGVIWTVADLALATGVRAPRVRQILANMKADGRARHWVGGNGWEATCTD